MRRLALPVLAGAALAVAFSSAASAQLVEKKAMTLAEAKKLVAAAEQKAAELKLPFCIAVMDEGGRLIYFERMDGAQWGSIRIAQAKAHAAMAFKRPTKTFEERVAKGGVGVLGLPGAIPSEGGVPLTANGQIIGSIGVSGGTSQQDGQVADAGAAALK